MINSSRDVKNELKAHMDNFNDLSTRIQDNENFGEKVIALSNLAEAEARIIAALVDKAITY